LKANKGMIPCKSIDYICYLQQLVTAQASRNRELEDQLERYRSRNPNPVGKHGGGSANDMGLVLHEDVDVVLGWLAHRTDASDIHMGRGGQPRGWR
jgi:hypothetical protein